MITLALGQCVWGLAYRWNSLTGGDNGINVRERPKFGGIDLANEVTFFYVVFGFFARLAAGDVHAGPLAVRPQPRRHPRARAAHADPRLQHLAAQIHRLHHRRRASADCPACCGRTPPASSARRTSVLTTSVDALLMAVLGGAGTLVGGVIGTVIVFGLREYPQHAGAVVAVRAGRRLRADDPLSADRPDGHSGAHAAAHDGRRTDNREATKETGSRDLLNGQSAATHGRSGR